MDVGIDTEKTNLFEPGVDNPGMDEDIELHPMTSSRRGSANPTSLHKTYEETSFGGDARDTTPLLEQEENVDNAWKIILNKFPNAKTDGSLFTARLDEYERVEVRPNRINGIYHSLFDKYGKLNEKLPKTIIDSLGPPAEDIIETINEEIARRNKKNK